MTPAFGRPRRSSRALVAALVLVFALPLGVAGAPPSHPNPALKVTVHATGGSAVALINSGDTFDGVTFEGIPDGLGVVPVGSGNRFIDIFIAFEQSHVPFGGFADFEDSSVQKARLDLKTNQIARLDEVLPPSAGFVRFCSAFMAGPEQGFADYTFFVNEESVDWLPSPGRRHLRRGPVSDSDPIPAGGLLGSHRREARRFPADRRHGTPQPREHGDRARGLG